MTTKATRLAGEATAGAADVWDFTFATVVALMLAFSSFETAEADPRHGVGLILVSLAVAQAFWAWWISVGPLGRVVRRLLGRGEGADGA